MRAGPSFTTSIGCRRENLSSTRGCFLYVSFAFSGSVWALTGVELLCTRIPLAKERGCVRLSSVSKACFACFSLWHPLCSGQHGRFVAAFFGEQHLPCLFLVLPLLLGERTAACFDPPVRTNLQRRALNTYFRKGAGESTSQRKSLFLRHCARTLARRNFG